MDVEIWKPLVDNPRYLVSNHGNIKSLAVGINLKPFINNRGYSIVRPEYGKGKQKNLRVHRVVALAFVDGWSEERCQVNHKDGNKSNNHKDNLEWVTPLENIQHAHDNELYSHHIPITVTDVQNGGVQEFKTFAKCAVYFNLNHKQVRAYARQYDTVPWQDRYLFRIGKARKRRGGKAVNAVNLRTRQLLVAGSISEMESLTKLPYNAMARALDAGRLCNGYFFWRADDGEEAMIVLNKLTQADVDKSIASYEANSSRQKG